MAHREQGWSRWYDDAPDHPKFLAAGHRGGWLYVCGQAYSSKHGTDGVIPKAVVPRLSDVPQPSKVASKLVEVGLWHDEGDHYRQHDYAEMQTTSAEREERREQARQRQRRARDRKRDDDTPVTRDTRVTSRVTDACVTGTEEEGEGEKNLTLVGTADAVTDEDDRFERFWDAYPRHHDTQLKGGGGNKKLARRRFAKLKRTHQDEVLAAVGPYAALCQPGGRFPKNAEGFVKDEFWKTFLEMPDPAADDEFVGGVRRVR